MRAQQPELPFGYRHRTGFRTHDEWAQYMVETLVSIEPGTYVEYIQQSRSIRGQYWGHQEPKLSPDTMISCSWEAPFDPRNSPIGRHRSFVSSYTGILELRSVWYWVWPYDVEISDDQCTPIDYSYGGVR